MNFDQRKHINRYVIGMVEYGGSNTSAQTFFGQY